MLSIYNGVVPYSILGRAGQHISQQLAAHTYLKLVLPRHISRSLLDRNMKVAFLVATLTGIAAAAPLLPRYVLENMALAPRQEGQAVSQEWTESQ